MNDAPILIVGCPRSGTTLLRDLLRSHSRLTFPLESRVLAELYRGHGDPRDAGEARRLAHELLRTWDIATWRLGLEPAALEHHRTFAGMAEALYAAWAAREGKPRWGDKTPLYVLELDTMLKLFPRAQVINLVRDGRDVALSLKRQPWGPSNAYTAALMWKRAVMAGYRAAERLPSSAFICVRYESLLADPEAQLRRLCGFLGEEFEPAMLRPSRLATPSGRPNPWPAHREGAVDRGNAGHWRTAMSVYEQGVFESVAGAELQRAGYPSAGAPRAPTPVRRVAWRTEDALRWLLWRTTTWDRGPRWRTTLILARARLAAVRRRAT